MEDFAQSRNRTKNRYFALILWGQYVDHRTHSTCSFPLQVCVWKFQVADDELMQWSTWSKPLQMWQQADVGLVCMMFLDEKGYVYMKEKSMNIFLNSVIGSSTCRFE